MYVNYAFMDIPKGVSFNKTHTDLWYFVVLVR